jgi:hypothetical protein
MDLFVTLNVATFENIECILNDPNSLQIFHFCCIHGNEREKSKPCCPTLAFKTFAYTFDFAKFKQCERVILRLQSRTKKK